MFQTIFAVCESDRTADGETGKTWGKETIRVDCDGPWLTPVSKAFGSNATGVCLRRFLSFTGFNGAPRTWLRVRQVVGPEVQPQHVIE